MRIGSSKKFDKMFKKAPEIVKKKFVERVMLLISNKNEPTLRRHKLSGKYQNYFSIDVTGDWRAIYTELENGDLLFFILFGTHSQLY
jgi:addiction module RelE/StbE family toxin